MYICYIYLPLPYILSNNVGKLCHSSRATLTFPRRFQRHDSRYEFNTRLETCTGGTHENAEGCRREGMTYTLPETNIKPTQKSGQISIIPKPELRGFWGSSLIKPPFRVTSADVVIICPEKWMVGILSRFLCGMTYFQGQTCC